MQTVTHTILRRVFYGLLIVAGLLWYRAWVEFTKVPLSRPLGFFETVSSLPILEEEAANPRSWEEQITSIVLPEQAFDRLIGTTQHDRYDVDVLVIGRSIGGDAAATAAASDGARVLLVTDSSEASSLPNVTMLSDQDLRALTGPDGITLHRALVRRISDGHLAIIRFRFLVDGTPTGRVLAQADAPYTVGWDTREQTGEPHAFSARMAEALALGYTQSGFTVGGIGKRLDGGIASMTVADRGFHGIKVLPTTRESCWTSTPTTAPFIFHGSVWRATNVGCKAGFTLDVDTTDTYELWVVHHGNDVLEGTVESAEGTRTMRRSGEAGKTMTLMGSLSIDEADFPTFTLTSSLPGDRMETVLLRKTNTFGATQEQIKMQQIFGAATKSIRSSGSVSLVGRPVVHQWSFTPPANGNYVVAIEEGCEQSCDIALALSGSTIFTQAILTTRASQPTPQTPVLLAKLTQGLPYILTIGTDSDTDAVQQWTLTHTSSASINGTTGINNATAQPRHTGFYDVWLLSDERTEIVLSTTEKLMTIPSTERAFVYAGIHFLSADQTLSATTKGSVTILIVPNARVDLYRKNVLPALTEQAINLRDVPSGTYTVHLVGTSLPTTAAFRSGSIPAIQPLTFEQISDTATSDTTIVHDGGPIQLTLPATIAPLELFLHETLPRFQERITIGSGSTMTVARPLEQAWLWPELPVGARTFANISKGILRLTTSDSGIGPVTLRSLESATLHDHVADRAYSEYFWTKFGRIAPCEDGTPACDPRRIIPILAVPTTADLPDGRRLRSRKLLSEESAFFPPTCHSATCAALRIPANGIVTVIGSGTGVNIFSQREEEEDILSRLLQRLRTDGILGKTERTWLDTSLRPRPVIIRLDMLFADGAPNVIPAARGIGATQIASRALRAPATEQAIGNAVGHVLAFATKRQMSLPQIADTPLLLEKLREHLIEKGVQIFPVDNVPDDPVLMQAVQRLILKESATLTPEVEESRVRFVTDALLSRPNDDVLREARIFGSSGRRTIRDLLKLVTNNSAATDEVLVAEGIRMGLLPASIEALPVAKILGQPLTRTLLLKGEFLLSLRP